MEGMRNVRYPKFDVSQLRLLPLAQRQNDMTMAEVAPLQCPEPLASDNLAKVADAVWTARKQGAPVILMMGAHVIKTGMSRFVIDLMESGWITHVAMNGACAIHDFELALQGATTESVARYIQEGQFGLWQETGRINDIVAAGVESGLGFGQALGQALISGDYPHNDISILAAGFRLQIPVTVHVAFGQDIIHEHPNFDAAAVGRATYEDFLVFTQAVTHLEGGVLLNVGSAIMGPEVYLKALAMARNAAQQRQEDIRHFTTAVFDIQPLSGLDISVEPGKDDPQYYHRYWKTILVRTVRDGGESYYVEGTHQRTIPTLWHVLTGR